MPTITAAYHFILNFVPENIERSNCFKRKDLQNYIFPRKVWHAARYI